MARRKPIDYQPQFGGGIFRPRDEVVDDLEALETHDEAEAEEGVTERTDVSSKQRSNVRTNDTSAERLKIRHSFDVFKDQITALAEIQAELFGHTGKKPKMGELVQEALDDYIAKKQERTNYRSNERKRR